MLRKRPWYIIKDTDELGSVELHPKQVFHPFLLSTLAVINGYYLVSSCQNGPRDSSYWVWNAFPCSWLKFSAWFTRLFELIEHFKPFFTPTTICFRVGSFVWLILYYLHFVKRIDELLSIFWVIFFGLLVLCRFTDVHASSNKLAELSDFFLIVAHSSKLFLFFIHCVIKTPLISAFDYRFMFFDTWIKVITVILLLLAVHILHDETVSVTHRNFTLLGVSAIRSIICKLSFFVSLDFLSHFA